MNIIRTSLGQINPQTGNPFTPQELIQDLQDNLNDEPNDDNDELNISGISNISGDSDNDLDVDLNFWSICGEGTIYDNSKNQCIVKKI